jgi:hypothetical protein
MDGDFNRHTPSPQRAITLPHAVKQPAALALKMSGVAASHSLATLSERSFHHIYRISIASGWIASSERDLSRRSAQRAFKMSGVAASHSLATPSERSFHHIYRISIPG